MMAIVRKQSQKINEAPRDVPKRTSREADRELTHIIQSVGLLSLFQGVASPLAPPYWIARLQELRAGYALLPTQLAQVSALERRVEALAERDKGGVAGSKRRVA